MVRELKSWWSASAPAFTRQLSALIRQVAGLADFSLADTTAARIFSVRTSSQTIVTMDTESADISG